MIMSDEIVFYGMLYHFAGHVARLSQSAHSVYSTHVLKYESKLIRLLNERLRDPEVQATEQTLITVN
jgi:hypothetical protein